jgi:hypothetical protein
MENRPTTFNGPLHTKAANLDDRHMLATFDTPDAARLAQQRLVEAGIAEERIAVSVHAGDSGEVEAAQHTATGMVGWVRDALLPDDNTRTLREAAREDQAVLEVRPLAGEADRIASIIEACGPRHFDPELERWRNA